MDMSWVKHLAAVATAAGVLQLSLVEARAAKLIITWDSSHPVWHGLLITNMDREPITVEAIELNGRNDCLTEIFDPRDPEISQAVKANPAFIYMPLTLAMLHSPGIFVDVRALTEFGVEGAPVVLKTGDSAPIVAPANCATVVNATVRTNRGEFDIEFDRPFIQTF